MKEVTVNKILLTTVAFLVGIVSAMGSHIFLKIDKDVEESKDSVEVIEKAYVQKDHDLQMLMLGKFELLTSDMSDIVLALERSNKHDELINLKIDNIAKDVSGLSDRVSKLEKSDKTQNLILEQLAKKNKVTLLGFDW